MEKKTFNDLFFANDIHKHNFDRCIDKFQNHNREYISTCYLAAVPEIFKCFKLELQTHGPFDWYFEHNTENSEKNGKPPKIYPITGPMAPLTSQTTALVHLALNLWNGYKFDLAEGLSIWDTDLFNIALQAIYLRRGEPIYLSNIVSILDNKSNTLVKESANTHSPTQNEPQVHNTLTFSEAWEVVFQRKISKDKLYSETRAGRIPHIRIGSKILFRRDTLNAYLAQNEIKSLR